MKHVACYVEDALAFDCVLTDNVNVCDIRIGRCFDNKVRETGVTEDATTIMVFKLMKNRRSWRERGRR